MLLVVCQLSRDVIGYEYSALVMSLARFDLSILSQLFVNQIVGWPVLLSSLVMLTISLSSITITYCFKMYKYLLEIKFPTYLELRRFKTHTVEEVCNKTCAYSFSGIPSIERTQSRSNFRL